MLTNRGHNLVADMSPQVWIPNTWRRNYIFSWMTKASKSWRAKRIYYQPKLPRYSEIARNKSTRDKKTRIKLFKLFLIVGMNTSRLPSPKLTVICDVCEADGWSWYFSRKSFYPAFQVLLKTQRFHISTSWNSKRRRIEERQGLQKEGLLPLLVFYFEDGFCMMKNLNTQ